jgi:hypothetical protein
MASEAATRTLLRRRARVRVSPPHAVMILGGSPLLASVELPALRPPRLAAPARPARRLVHASHLLAGSQSSARGRDELAVGGRLLFQRPGRHQVQAGSQLRPGHHRIGAAAVAACGLADFRRSDKRPSWRELHSSTAPQGSRRRHRPDDRPHRQVAPVHPSRVMPAYPSRARVASSGPSGTVRPGGRAMTVSEGGPATAPEVGHES